MGQSENRLGQEKMEPDRLSDHLHFLRQRIDHRRYPPLIMQKIINVLAVVSFAVSAGIVSAGVVTYVNRDALLEQAKEEVFAAMGEALSGQLGQTLLSGPDPTLDMDESGAVPIPAIPF